MRAARQTFCNEPFCRAHSRSRLKHSVDLFWGEVMFRQLASKRAQVPIPISNLQFFRNSKRRLQSREHLVYRASDHVEPALVRGELFPPSTCRRYNAHPLETNENGCARHNL